MNYQKTFDVIIVGGGHAGVEAARAAADAGADALLLTHNIETIGQMSCNPAIGGIGKGHLVREIDALGGLMGRAADQSGIQYRRLNATKGPAVRATRAQADRVLYKNAIRSAIEAQPNLTLFQQAVDDILIENDRVCGVVTQMGLTIQAKTVVLTVGTFLGGKIHIGHSNFAGGRAGDPPANKLAERLRARPFRVDRLKTGTPPRIDGRSIDYTHLQPQHSDDPLPLFSFTKGFTQPKQIPCHSAYTNAKTHDIITSNIERSPMYSGVIEGVGPRYCPSIEDKVVRFAERDAHQIFIEPEGLSTFEVYPNGISTCLPFEVQVAFVRSIEGFENAHITRPGYAIEYDYFDPRDLNPSLETKYVAGLFFAGQINGTTGYEEAAAQGLLAGLNAARLVQGLPSWTPRRDQAYLGVLVDDLTTQGTLEPYRMFTSRAEYRLILREDNADRRLTSIGYELGIVSKAQYQAFLEKAAAIERSHEHLKTLTIQPGTPAANRFLELTDKPLSKDYKGHELLRRPDIDYTLAQQIFEFEHSNTADVIEQVEIDLKYEGYIDRQAHEIAKQKRLEDLELDIDTDYQLVKGLSNEVREKLSQHRPTSIAAAARIPGVTPAAISLLLVHLKQSA